MSDTTAWEDYCEASLDLSNQDEIGEAAEYALEEETRALRQETAQLKDQKFYFLCKSLLQAIDAGSEEAEESVLCRIRVAVREAQ